MAASRLAAAGDVVTELTDCVTVIDTESEKRNFAILDCHSLPVTRLSSAPARPENIHLKQQTIVKLRSRSQVRTKDLDLGYY